MDSSEADCFRTEPPELFHIIKFHDAWTDHRERSLFGESLNSLPIVFLCRLAGDASASTAVLLLQFPKMLLLAIRENSPPRHAVERNRFRCSLQSACNGDIVLISRDFDDYRMTRSAFDHLHAVDYHLSLFHCVAGVRTRDIDFKCDEIKAIEHLCHFHQFLFITED